MATTTERPLADALTAIKTRRSVKEYLPTEIPREWIEELLDAAHWGTQPQIDPSLAFPRVLRRGARAIGRSPTGGSTLGRGERVSGRAKTLSASLGLSVIRPQS